MSCRAAKSWPKATDGMARRVDSPSAATSRIDGRLKLVGCSSQASTPAGRDETVEVVQEHPSDLPLLPRHLRGSFTP